MAPDRLRNCPGKRWKTLEHLDNSGQLLTTPDNARSREELWWDSIVGGNGPQGHDCWPLAADTARHIRNRGGAGMNQDDSRYSPMTPDDYMEGTRQLQTNLDNAGTMQFCRPGFR